uniref:Guanine nucleotide binding protein, alpha subunit n=1 Tax=Hirondellea gigas TaxID=1518452 RepID=A0A6A7FZ96_9CRUS
MGAVCGSSTIKDTGDSKSRRVDLEIGQGGKAHKLLLLGAGESGKSTIFKQFNHLYGDGYSEEGRMAFVETIMSNTIVSMITLVQQALTREITDFRGEQYDCTLGDELAKSVQFFTDIDTQSDLIMTREVADHIKKLWASPGIQNVFQLSSLYQLPDAVEYLFSRLDAFLEPDYCPSYADILRSRVRSTGIVETTFSIKNHLFRVLDVGGQRNERTSWKQCFECVTAVIFVVALSEYDQCLFEDESKNRMAEAMTLFSEICNSRWFFETSMILFLNKSDLFRDKLERIPINVLFEEYLGGSDFESSCEHIRANFVALNMQQNKDVYTHVTCATNTETIKKVFQITQSIVINTSLRRAGFM